LTRTDRAVVGALVIVLLALTVAIGATNPPTPIPVRAGASPTPSSAATGPRPYREGVLGRATSISPLTARTRADRDLVGLVFSGLVALGPKGTLVPGLAKSWSSDKTGKRWTFRLRNTHWHDGVAVTAADVVFTVHTIQDPDYTGPAVGSWKDVTAVAVNERTVRFELATPLGGFLQAATLPIVPAHLLEDVPVDQLGDHPFGQAPVGTGPFKLVSLDENVAILTPAAQSAGAGPQASTQPSPQPSPSGDVAGSVPLPGIEIHFFDDPVMLAHAYETGEVDAVAGLPAAEASRLASLPDSRLMKYPTTTLTAIFFNLRVSHPIFRDGRVRKALLTAIDRTRIVSSAYGSAATRADSLIPPTSWAFDQKSSRQVKYDRVAARQLLRNVGWKWSKPWWKTVSGKKTVSFELLGPDADTNQATYAAVASIVKDWRSLGLKVTQVGLTPAELVGERIQTGNFEAVVVDINVGLDPDLYPILASTQTRSGGLNVGGLQDQDLDRLLAAARKPASKTKRVEAYKALQKALATANYVLPIAFRDETVVLRNTVLGPTIRPISDGSERFWDVLTWRLAIGR
jgi:peptide/nickel transport system substrate-binding protein